MDIQGVSESFDNFGFRIYLVLYAFPECMDDKDSAIPENKNKKLGSVTSVLYVSYLETVQAYKDYLLINLILYLRS